MVKRKGTISTGISSSERSTLSYIALQNERRDKMARYMKRHNHMINISGFIANKPCPICGTIIEEVMNNSIHAHFEQRKSAGETDPYICWICCNRMTEVPRGCEAPKPKRPRGWQFMPVYVDSNKNVFYKGVEQPNLKGTLPITVIETPKIIADTQDKKLSRKDKDLIKHDALMEINTIKTTIKKGVDADGKKLGKMKMRELMAAIKKQEKFINKIG